MRPWCCAQHGARVVQPQPQALTRTRNGCAAWQDHGRSAPQHAAFGDQDGHRAAGLTAGRGAQTLGWKLRRPLARPSQGLHTPQAADTAPEPAPAPVRRSRLTLRALCGRSVRSTRGHPHADPRCGDARSSTAIPWHPRPSGSAGADPAMAMIPKSWRRSGTATGTASGQDQGRRARWSTQDSSRRTQISPWPPRPPPPSTPSAPVRAPAAYPAAAG